MALSNNESMKLMEKEIYLHQRDLQLDDLACVAKVHKAAFPDSALTQFGDEVVRRYYEWQLIGPHDVVALGSWVSGKLAGFCIGGVFHGALSGFIKRNQRYLIWQVLTHPWLLSNELVRQRIRLGSSILVRIFDTRVSSVSPTVSNEIQNKKKSFGILAIAVSPENRQLGIGRQMMDSMEKVAISRGFRELSLTVHVENLQAIAFYERLGWKKNRSKDSIWTGSMYKQLIK